VCREYFRYGKLIYILLIITNSLDKLEMVDGVLKGWNSIFLFNIILFLYPKDIVPYFIWFIFFYSLNSFNFCLFY